MAVSSPLHEVAQHLTQDRNSTRITKLVFYACKGVWENDLAKLNTVPLQDLIAELIQLYPTLEQLKTHLDKRVQTLSKAAEYTLIANSITNTIKPLYADYQDATQVVFKPNRYAEIADQFEHDADRVRIKKLLFAACYSRWENDVTQLDAITFEFLIQQLAQLVSTAQQLNAVLASIVKTLNRKAEYTLVSDKIFEAIQSLYYVDVVEQTQPLTAITPLPQRQAPVSHEIVPEPIAPPADISLDSPPASPPLEDIDWFDVRMEIMKYTSPLRAKILIFSALHQPLTINSQTWSLIRSHQLDTLVETLFHTYKTLAELDARLKHVANRLIETDQYIQATGAILRAMRLVYGRSPLAATAPEASSPSARPAPAAPSTVANHAADNDNSLFFSLPTSAWQADADPGDDSGGEPTQVL